MGATPAQIAMVTADQPHSSPLITPAGMTPKQAAALQAQLSKASSPQEALKIAQAHGLNAQQAAQVVKQVQQGGAGGLTNGSHGAQNGGQVNGSGPQRSSQGAAKGISPQKAAGNQGPLQSAQRGNQEPVGVAGSTLLALQQKVK